MNIACATNFSDASQHAGTTAALLARRMNASLLLVHAIPGGVVKTFGERAREAVENALHEEARRLESLTGVDVHPVVRAGDTEKALSALVTERDLRLVVAAAPREEAPFLRLGGTVDRMAQALTVPFLVVREGAALEAWANGERPLRVMVGLDRSRPFEVARDWVKALSHFGPLEVVGGRIFWVSEEARRLGLVHPRSYKDVSLELREALEREADSLLEPLRLPGVKVRARLEPGLGRVADHLVALAEEEHVDLLVVGTHHRRALARLWSVSQHARRLASMSVVSVPVLITAEQGLVEELPKVRSVLASTDFTEPGDRAVAYAFALTPPGGTVHLLHVEPADASPEAIQAAHHQLELRVPPTETERHKVELTVLKGNDVAGIITQAAERYCVDLLCLGTHGRTGMSRVVMGSVAQQVMDRSDRPAVTVRMPRA